MNKRTNKGLAQRWLKLCIMAAALLMALPWAAHAQQVQPTPCDPGDPDCCPGPFCPQLRMVRGTITSCAGAPLAGITVDINGSFHVETVTDASGYYSVIVPVGNYTVTPRPTTGFIFRPQSQLSIGLSSTNFTRYLSDNRADFDGDCKTDLSVFTLNTGVWSSLNSSNGQYVAFQFGQSTDILAPGDYNGDGKTDRAVFRPSSGYWYIATDTSGNFYGLQFGTNGDIPVARDYDGDGKTDIAVFRPSNNIWYILNSSNNTVTIVQFGISGDRPVPGNYDSDTNNQANIAVLRPSTNVWYIRRPDGTFYGIQFGGAGDRPVPADYDGDGRTDLAMFIPGVGQWWILQSSLNYQLKVLYLGLSSDLLVPGDYDGDGQADVAVWSPASGKWLILKSSDWLIDELYFGSSADVPVPSFYVPQ